MLISKTLLFLSELRQNNNRDWFEANRERYREIQSGLNSLAERVIASLMEFDPTLAGLTAKDCTYRIYRDTRFSNDKTPYKTHIGIYICRGGKKSGYAGYYIHLEPGNSILGIGLYAPEPKVLLSVREEILDNGAEFVRSIKDAKGFTMDENYKLKRTPKGFPADSEYDELLKLKWFTMAYELPEKVLKSEDTVVQWCSEAFKTAKNFTYQLNRAVKYAYEEM